MIASADTFSEGARTAICGSTTSCLWIHHHVTHLRIFNVLTNITYTLGWYMVCNKFVCFFAMKCAALRISKLSTYQHARKGARGAIRNAHVARAGRIYYVRYSARRVIIFE